MTTKLKIIITLFVVGVSSGAGYVGWKVHHFYKAVNTGGLVHTPLLKIIDLAFTSKLLTKEERDVIWERAFKKYGGKTCAALLEAANELNAREGRPLLSEYCQDGAELMKTHVKIKEIVFREEKECGTTHYCAVRMIDEINAITGVRYPAKAKLAPSDNISVAIEGENMPGLIMLH